MANQQALSEQPEARKAWPAARAPADERAAGPDPGRGQPLAASLDELALIAFGRPARQAGADPTPDLGSAEELMVHVEERDLQVRYEERGVTSLRPQDMPCVLLRRDGSTLLLLSAAGGVATCRCGGVERRVDLAELEAGHAGVVLFVSERAADTDGADASAGSPPSLIRTVTRHLLQGHRGALVRLGTATLVGNVLLIALPLFSMSVYDRVVPHLAWETLWALTIGMVIVLACDMAVRTIRMRLLDAISLPVALTLQSRLYARILHGRTGASPVSLGAFTTCLKDVDALCQSLPALLVALAVDLPWFVAVTILIGMIAGSVALVPLLGAVALAAVHLWGRAGYERTLVAARLAGTQVSQSAEALAAGEAVKVAGAERTMLRRFARLGDEVGYALHEGRFAAGMPVQASLVIGQAMIVAALVIGVYEISSQATTVGGLSAATLLISRMTAPASQLIALVSRIAELSRALRAPERILATPQESPGDAEAPAGRSATHGTYVFRGAGLTYPGETAACLSGVSLTIAAGEKIGLIGRSGGGKSTLLRLMLRLHDVTEGTVSLDGSDIRQVDPRRLRRSIGFMRQDATLLDDTLRGNICLGLDGVDETAFEIAVEIAGVKELAARRPDGFSMKVGPRGERLSGGERQSVALARALAADPPILILDEPTASMDNALEARIVRDLASFAASKTLVIATHRAPLLSLVDRLIWIESGRVVADGPKADVLLRLKAAA